MNEVKEQMLNEKYTCRGVIKGFNCPTSHLNPTPDEGRLTLEIHATTDVTLNLECFIYGQEPYDLHSRVYRVGDEALFSFDLLPFQSGSKVGQKRKFITAKNGVDYLINGEILEISTHPRPEMADTHNRIIVDCVIYLKTDVVKSQTLKVGDYILITGRLDAHIVGKVN